MSRTRSNSAAAHSGFTYTREQFEQHVEDALALAKKLGASDAGAEVSEGVGGFKSLDLLILEIGRASCRERV